MRESVNKTMVSLDVTDPNTGEFFKINGTSEEIKKYYSIKRITSRINSMDLFSVLKQSCNSSLDIEIVDKLINMSNYENEIRIDNVTNLSKEIGISRSKLNKILKNLIDLNFLLKLDRGVYLINSFIFVGNKVNSNEKRENAQKRWMELISQEENQG